MVLTREVRLPTCQSLGMIPSVYYTGRGPLEAASLEVKLEPDDIAFRCNLVTLKIRGEQDRHGRFRCRSHHE